MWTKTITLTLHYSPEMAEIAAKIGKAMDIDTGGERSFSRTITGYNDEEPIYGDTLVCTTGCADSFAEQVPLLWANPAMLHGLCAQDYAARWGDLVPPTLEECVAFCAAVVLPVEPELEPEPEPEPSPAPDPEPVPQDPPAPPAD